MANGNGFKIPAKVIVPIAVCILLAVLGFLATMVTSNADEISGVKAETKVNTTAIDYQDQSLQRIEAGVLRLETRFNTQPAKKE